jgi:NitT/TauT family transport system substrate-binding protein
MRRHRAWSSRSWLIAATTVAVLHAATASAQPLNIRIGWANTPATISPLLFQKTDIMRHHGRFYTVEAIKFTGTTPALEAMKAGTLDIGSMSFSNIGAAIVQQGMKDLRIIADGNQGGVAGYASISYYVRNDGAVKSNADLKGKQLVANAIGGAADFGLRAVLKKHGLIDKRDYTLWESAFPTLVGLLLSGKADLVAMTAPFVFDPKLKANAHALFNLEAELGPIQQLVTVAREGFIAQHRAALVDFFEDYLISLQWFHDPKNRAEATRILANFTMLSEERFAGWVFDKGDFYHEPWARPNIPALTANLAMLRDLDFLPVALDPAPYVDLSLIDAAGRRLK